jgi:hypothetical protein
MAHDPPFGTSFPADPEIAGPLGPTGLAGPSRRSSLVAPDGVQAVADDPVVASMSAPARDPGPSPRVLAGRHRGSPASRGSRRPGPWATRSLPRDASRGRGLGARALVTSPQPGRERHPSAPPAFPTPVPSPPPRRSAVPGSSRDEGAEGEAGRVALQRRADEDR